MYTTLQRSFAFRAIAIGLTIALSLFGFAFSTAKADQTPAGCLANDFTTQLNKSTALAYDQTNPNGATTITYSVDAGNPQNGSSNGCNIDGVTITLTTPDGVVHTLQTGGSYPVGTALAQVGAPVTYVANSANVVGGDLTVSATATGALHDKVGGTDPLSSSKTLSLSVIHPNTTVTVTPSVATTSAGSSINLTVTEHNTGDDPLASSSVTLTPPGTTLNASSTSFTGGDTGSDGILGVGETWTWLVPATVSANTIYTAVGTGTDSLGHPVTSPNYHNEAASTTVHVLNIPAIATTLSASSTNLGTAVHDSAVLSGATSNAGGSVTYSAYAGASCSGSAVFTNTQTVASTIVPDSSNFTASSTGTFNWQAVYSGDANNSPATSTCLTETLTVSQLTPTVTTHVHDTAHTVITAAPIGSTVHDTVAVTGSGPTPTGTVAFNLYTNPSCDSATTTQTVALVSGIAESSGTTVPATSLGYRAYYNGDANYSPAFGACEPLAANRLNPTISTTLSSTTVNTGSAAHDSATLSGATGTAGGTVTYTVYTNNLCTLGAQSAGTKTVTSGVVPNSDPITFNTAGTYYWQVAYSGDVGNGAATSTCGSEVLTVGKLAPTITTTLSATTAATTTPVHDSATLSGASSDAGGTVAYTAYTNNTCTVGAQSAGTKTVTAGVVPDSDPLTFATPGTYYWQAAYSGDAKNAAATSTCGREVLTVAAPPPSTGCDDWKFVGAGWVNFGPIVYLNRGGQMFNPNNSCRPTLPLQFSPTNPASPTGSTSPGDAATNPISNPIGDVINNVRDTINSVRNVIRSR